MNRIAVKDLDTGMMVPVGDPGNWTCNRLLFESAEMSNGWILCRCRISELIEARIWKAAWSTLPDIPTFEDPDDQLSIARNEDFTR